MVTFCSPCCSALRNLDRGPLPPQRGGTPCACPVHAKPAQATAAAVASVKEAGSVQVANVQRFGENGAPACAPHPAPIPCPVHLLPLATPEFYPFIIHW